MAIPSITALPAVPSTNDSDFESTAQAFLNALKGTTISELNAAIAAINALGSISNYTRVFIDNTDSPYAASSGQEIWANTTSGVVTVNLPSGGVGNGIKIVDWKGTFSSNNCTVAPNGSENIEGANSNYTLSIDNESAEFAYTEASYGWGVKERS